MPAGSRWLIPGSTAIHWRRMLHTAPRGRNGSSKDGPGFGLLFDIDGVIIRGRKVLDAAKIAFQKLTDGHGSFRVPTVFVTNAGNMMRHQKAKQLSDWLEVEVQEDQVVMSHSPLRMFKQFHDKHCLISGQGPIVEIAKGIGFSHVTTVDDLRRRFPFLDAVDHKRRLDQPSHLENQFSNIEAVVLFGEPVRWETSLQLILDVLTTQGTMATAPSPVPYPHLPILACNMDLQWVAEAPLPRLGHGAFMVCLENLYKKITGKEMMYTALVGKPSEITFHHAEHCLVEFARKKLNITSPIQRLYTIGDNLNTDIYGANLYDRYLRKRLAPKERIRVQTNNAGSRVQLIDRGCAEDKVTIEGATSCESILVMTGVSTQEEMAKSTAEHSPRDFLPIEADLMAPRHCVQDVNAAVSLILSKERFS